MRRRATPWALASLLLLAVASVGGSSVAAGGDDTIDVASYNVLAPQWAGLVPGRHGSDASGH